MVWSPPSYFSVVVHSIEARQPSRSGVPLSVILCGRDLTSSFLSMFGSAKSQAIFPCSELQIFTPKVAVFSSDSWLATSLSIHIKTKGGSIESEQKLETVNPPNFPFSLKVTRVTPAANLLMSSLKRSFETAIRNPKEPHLFSMDSVRYQCSGLVSFRFK